MHYLKVLKQTNFAAEFYRKFMSGLFAKQQSSISEPPIGEGA